MQLSKASALYLMIPLCAILSAEPIAWLMGALSPIAIAICIIYLLQPFVNNLQQFSSLPRWICILLSFLTLFLLLLILVFLLFPRLNQAISALLSLDYCAIFSQGILEKIRPYLPLEQIPSLLQDLLAPLLRYSASALQWTGNLCMSFCIAYYALKDSHDLCYSLSHYILRFLPKFIAYPLLNILDILDRTFWSYLRGRLYISLVLGAFCTLIFSLLNLLLGFQIPSPLLMGFITAIANLVPLLGPLIATGFCLILSLSCGLPEMLAVLAVCLAAQLLDNLLLTPRLDLGLSPFWILSGFAVASFWGIGGMLLVLPILSACATIFRQNPGFLSKLPERFK